MGTRDWRRSFLVGLGSRGMGSRFALDSRGMFVCILLMVGCGERLAGSTWQGTYKDWTVTYDFVSQDTVKRTIESKHVNPDVDTLTYAVDGKLVKLTLAGMVSTATLDNGTLVAVPADIGLNKDDSTTHVVFTKKK